MAIHVLRQNPLHSNAVNKLSMGAENFLFRLMQAVDRYGCFDGRVAMLRALLYPLKVDEIRQEEVNAWLTECINAGLVKLYEVNDEVYLEVQGFKHKPGSYKTPYPEPPYEQEAVQQHAVTKQAAIAAKQETKPEPGKEHEYYLTELFIRENDKYLTGLAEKIRQPYVKYTWIQAFNEHLKSEGKRYTKDYDWLQRLKVWLPLNIQRLIQEESPTPKPKQRHKPMVL